MRGASSRAHSNISISTAKSAKRSMAAPDCRAPRNSPGPRISRSRLAISKPSEVSTIALKRSRAVSLTRPLSPVAYISTQADAAAPRPTRPLSWWSCERPNRSACSITMSEALGTSTPTSITVVLTNTPIVPLSNNAMTAFFSAGGMREWSKPTITGFAPGGFKASVSKAWVSVALVRSSASLSSINGQTQ